MRMAFGGVNSVGSRSNFGLLEWEATTAHGEVYSADDEEDLPLNGMNTNACQFTTCPIRPSTKHTYTYTLPLAKKFPVVCILVLESIVNIPMQHHSRCLSTIKFKKKKETTIIKFKQLRNY